MGDHQISSIHAFFADLRSTKGRHLVQEINSSLHHRIHQSGTSPLAQTQIKLQHRVDIQLLEHACMTTFIRLMREDAIIENRRLHPCGHQQRTSDNEAINQQYHASLRCSQHCPTIIAISKPPKQANTSSGALTSECKLTAASITFCLCKMPAVVRPVPAPTQSATCTLVSLCITAAAAVVLPMPISPKPSTFPFKTLTRSRPCCNAT